MESANGQKKLMKEITSKFELCHCTEIGSLTAKCKVLLDFKPVRPILDF